MMVFLRMFYHTHFLPYVTGMALAEYFSVESYPDPYCDVVEEMEMACFENSILELWANDGK